MRRAVDPGPFEETDAADAQDVGDEAEARAVEGEQHRTARELPLCLLDAVQPSARQVDFGLQDAVGPDQRDEVGARRAPPRPTENGCRLWPGPEAVRTVSTAVQRESVRTASRVPMPEVFDRR